MAEKEYEIYEAGEESCGHCIFDVDDSCHAVTGDPARHLAAGQTRLREFRSCVQHSVGRRAKVTDGKAYEVYEVGDDVKRACHGCAFDDSLCAGSSDDPDAPCCVTEAKRANISIKRAAFRWKDQQNG